jgi:GDP-D-mannose 3', 5'-epimerase
MIKSEKILITGAGGFIGHHLSRFLRNKGYWVRGVDIVHPRFSSLDDFDEFKILDLRDFRNCIEAMGNIDKVYALAALNGSIEYTTTERAIIVRDNTTININTAESAVASKIKRLFYSSSACVYPIWKQMEGNISSLREEDSYPAMPDSEYGWEKLYSERMYKSYEADFGLNVRIARFFNIYGPECLIDTLKSKAPMALTRKVIEAGNKGTVEIWGDGKQVRSFCYIDDCCEGIWKIMESEYDEPINIGTTDHISINDLVDLIAKIEGIKIKKIFQPNKIQGVRARICDYSKAERLLGWKRKVIMEKGLKEINKFVHKQLGK